MKRIITICLVLTFALAMFAIPVHADSTENLSWTFEPWWYSQTEEFFGVNPANPADKCKPAYTTQVMDGTKSFKVEMDFTANVTDSTIQTNGWDTFNLYLAMNGTPSTDLKGAAPDEKMDYPGYVADNGVTEVLYDSLFLAFKRWPAGATATVRLMQIKDSVVSELASFDLTAEQRANDHNFNLVYEYNYTSDDNNSLSVTLDGVKIFTLDNCKDKVVGSIAVSTVYSFFRATKYTITYIEAAPTQPDTGDFGVIALAFVAISSVVVKKKKEN